jgi:hypothetical protein
MTQNERKSNASFVVGDKNEELEEVVQNEGKTEVEDDQSSDSKNDDRFGDDDSLSSDEGDNVESSTSGETHPKDCTIDDDDDTTTDDDDEYIEQPPKSKRKSTSDILFTTGLGITSENQFTLCPSSSWPPAKRNSVFPTVLSFGGPGSLPFTLLLI